MICKGCFKEKGSLLRCPACGYEEGGMPADAEALSPGTALDARYIIGNIIVRSEESITYQGYDSRLELLVLIRQKRRQADQRHFLQKARWFACLNDSHSIIDIYGCRKMAGTYFMILEYAEGVPGAGRLPENMMSGSIVVRGQDILVGEQGRFRIVDFEIMPEFHYARSAAEDDSQEESDEFLKKDTELHGHYRIVRPLGRGGFGITYLAFDETLGRYVAIKEYMPCEWVMRNVSDQCVEVVSSAVLDDYKRGLSRFHNEAVIMAEFNENPLIASVYDFFCENETAYIVMEYVDGQNIGKLGRLIGGFGYEAAKDLFRSILCAVRAIHRRGVVHGDISPGNVILDKKNSVKLIDFGSAHRLGKRSAAMPDKMIKPGYAAIEQYDGEYPEDERSDVYQSAATFYTLITGKTPIEASARWKGEELKFPSELGIDIPARDERALRKALEVRPDRRMSGVDEFMDALYGERNTPELKLWK